MHTHYEEIVDVSKIGKRSEFDKDVISKLAEREDDIKFSEDSPRRLLLAFDIQNDLMEDGALRICGSHGDVERITRFIYNNIAGISKIVCTQATHTEYQIFHPCWWENAENENPEPYTTITYRDVLSGRWQAVFGDPRKSLKYFKKLDELGKSLCVWPYHCIDGTEGHKLETEFHKMAYFHSLVRKVENSIIVKGNDPYSEMFGVLKSINGDGVHINVSILKLIEDYDEIYIVGEPASHFVLESVKQIGEHFASCPEITEKITVLSDCMSPIKGYEEYSKRMFEICSKKYGVNVAKSDEIKLSI